MFESSNRTIIQTQNSKTTQKWVTGHSSPLTWTLQKMSEWTEEEKMWIWRSGVILDEGMVSDLVSGVLWPEPCRRWVSELKRRRCESEDLEWFWMKEWSLISCQVFSDLNPVEDEWGELKRRSCESEGSGVILDEGMVSDLVSGVLWPEPCRRWVSELKRRRCESEDLEWFWMKEWSLISCQVFSDLNPVEDEWGELKRRSCESEGSGVILDEGMVSDLVSGVLWPEPCRRWVRWTEEEKLWIWRIWSDSGWRNGLWSRVRCSLIWTL